MTFDAADPGTSAETWRGDPRLGALPHGDLVGVDALVVLAAHPDDETLGAGGLIARAVAAGLPVTVVVVTDGAASAPAFAARRAEEVRAAVRVLGAPEPTLLGYADGSVREEHAEIERDIERLLADLPGNTLLVAPWRGDGHRDHRVLGEVAARVAGSRELRLWEYPIWLWHWATPDQADVPWSRMVSLPLDAAAVRAKALALAEFPSQTQGPAPMLHSRFLEHFAGPVETFVV